MEIARPALSFGTQFWRWTENRYYEMIGRIQSFLIGTTHEQPEWIVQLTRKTQGDALVHETYLLTRMSIGTDHRLTAEIYVMPVPKDYPIELEKIQLDRVILWLVG